MASSNVTGKGGVVVMAAPASIPLFLLLLELVLPLPHVSTVSPCFLIAKVAFPWWGWVTTGGKCHWWEVTHPGPGHHAYAWQGLATAVGLQSPGRLVAPAPLPLRSCESGLVFWKMMKEAETHNFSPPFQTPPWRSEFYLLPLSETMRERETEACRRVKRRKRAAPVTQTHCTKQLERGQSQFSSTGQKHLKMRQRGRNLQPNMNLGRLKCNCCKSNKGRMEKSLDPENSHCSKNNKQEVTDYEWRLRNIPPRATLRCWQEFGGWHWLMILCTSSCWKFLCF